MRDSPSLGRPSRITALRASIGLRTTDWPQVYRKLH